MQIAGVSPADLARGWRPRALLALVVLALAWSVSFRYAPLYVPTMVLVYVGYFLPGFVLLTRLRPGLAPFVRLTLAPAVSFVAYGAVMLAFLALDWPYAWLTAVQCAVLGLALAGFMGWRQYRTLRPVPWWPLGAQLALFIAAALLLALPLAPNAVPKLLADNHHTRIPTLAGDSYLPYRTAQFVVHRLPLDTTDYYFGHLISERTPWMGLNTAYWLLALRADVPTEIWVTGDFWVSEVTGTFLNSLIVLPACWLLRLLLPRFPVRLFTLLLLLNPFVFIHTVYTRPGNLVGCLTLIAMSLLVIYRRQGRWVTLTVSGVAAGFAYLSHPMGAAYAIGLGLYVLGVGLSRRTLLPPVVWGAISAALVLPWEYWTRFVYGRSSVFYEYATQYGGPDPWFWPWRWFISAYRTVSSVYLAQPPAGDGGFPTLLSLAYDIIWQHYLFTLPGALTLLGCIVAYITYVRRFRLLWPELTAYTLVPLAVICIVYPNLAGQTTFGLHGIVVVLIGFAAFGASGRLAWATMLWTWAESALVLLGFLLPVWLLRVPQALIFVAGWTAALGLLAWRVLRRLEPPAQAVRPAHRAVGLPATLPRST